MVSSLLCSDCFAFTLAFSSSNKCPPWEWHLTTPASWLDRVHQFLQGGGHFGLFLFSLVASITCWYWTQWENSLNPALLTWWTQSAKVTFIHFIPFTHRCWYTTALHSHTQRHIKIPAWNYQPIFTYRLVRKAKREGERECCYWEEHRHYGDGDLDTKTCRY